MKVKKLYEKIFYYEDILKDSFILIDEIEKTDSLCNESTIISKWKPWTASDDNMTSYGLGKSGFFKINNLINENDFDLYKISSVINYTAEFAISSYCNLHRINKPWLPNFFNIKKYNEGVDMGPHVDSSDPTNIEHPVISGVMYLNDNYEGGEINFPNQGVSIKPKAGSVIIFPSTDPYLHHPQKIDYGTKYMVPLFWYKEPF